MHLRVFALRDDKYGAADKYSAGDKRARCRCVFAEPALRYLTVSRFARTFLRELILGYARKPFKLISRAQSGEIDSSLE